MKSNKMKFKMRVIKDGSRFRVGIVENCFGYQTRVAQFILTPEQSEPIKKNLSLCNTYDEALEYLTMLYKIANLKSEMKNNAEPISRASP